MRNIFTFIFTFFFFSFLSSQEKVELKKTTNNFSAGIGVVDMKKILGQSTAYQSIVEQFEEIRRKHRNTDKTEQE